MLYEEDSSPDSLAGTLIDHVNLQVQGQSGQNSKTIYLVRRIKADQLTLCVEAARPWQHALTLLPPLSRAGMALTVPSH